jgi:NAD(P)H-quinone oxidoreductase subunit 5
LAAFIIGAGLSFMVYRRNLGINTWFQTNLAPLYQFSFNKWYFDEVYLGFVQKALLPVYNRTWSIVDKGIVDGIVNMWGLIAIGTGEVMRYGQNGRGQYYVVMIFACVAGLSRYDYRTTGRCMHRRYDYRTVGRCEHYRAAGSILLKL